MNAARRRAPRGARAAVRPRPASGDLLARARRVRLAAFDVDGVLTDGTVWIGADGGVAKRFSIRDGAALVRLGPAGIETAFVTGRDDPATAARARDLRIDHLREGVRDKLRAMRALAAERGCTLAEVAFMGDDLIDLETMRAVGLGAAPADGAAEAKAAARFVSRFGGGAGAVRELCELLLKARGAWP